MLIKRNFTNINNNKINISSKKASLKSNGLTFQMTALPAVISSTVMSSAAMSSAELQALKKKKRANVYNNQTQESHSIKDILVKTIPFVISGIALTSLALFHMIRR